MQQNADVKDLAQKVINQNKSQNNKSQFILWMGALVVGAILGYMGIKPLNELFNFIATVYTRLFQFIAVPTIALAVITTLAALGSKKETGQIFAHAVVYTFLTTVCAAGIGLAIYLWVAPGNLPAEIIGSGMSNVPQNLGKLSYYDHILNVIPNNMLQPFLAGNVLSVMLIAAAMGLGLAFMPKTENREALLKTVLGFQELLFTLIKALLFVLPLGILAFAGQLSAQIEAGVIVGALGKYTLVIMASNCVQFFIVLPIFLLARGLNPIDVFKKMSPAVAVALFTKSSAGTLPVTMASAEQNLKVNKAVSRFVLPICTTINMNGCAAFILITSIFVMQNAGFELSMSTIAAIATPPGAGGIGIVRLSGPRAKALLARMFLPLSPRFENFRPWFLHRGRVLDRYGEALDDVLAVFMAVNLVTSALALARYDARTSGAAPANAVDVLLDEHFDNARMERIYPNAKKVEKAG